MTDERRTAALWAVHACMLPLLNGKLRRLPEFMDLVQAERFADAGYWIRARADAQSVAHCREIILEVSGALHIACNENAEVRWLNSCVCRAAAAAVQAGITDPVVEMVAAGLPPHISRDLQAAEDTRASNS